MTATVPERPRRLAYLGNPAVAVGPLWALHEASERLGTEVVVVVTAEDRRRSRRGVPSPTPVAQAAVELGLPVAHHLSSAVDSDADLGVVVAYGQIIPVSLLNQLPMLNLHFSLLPRWRGAAPVERALLAGDVATGVCLMDVAEELDTGGIRGRVTTPIGPEETAEDLRGRLGDLGARLLVDGLAAGLEAPEPQQGEPTWAHKIGSDDLRLDWSRPASELDRMVRVGGAHTTFRGERFKVHSAVPCDGPANGPAPGTLVGDMVVTGSGGLRLVEVQPANRSRMAFSAWVAGARPTDGEGFASDG